MSGINLSFNTVLIEVASKKQGGSSPAYNRLLEKISGITGGLTISDSTAVQAIERIKNNISTYYELAFLYDGNPQPKNILLKTPGRSFKVYYKKKFTAKEIKNHLLRETGPKIHISNCSVKGRSLKFTVGDFIQSNSPGIQAAAIQVRIELIDGQNKTVWRTQNTLKSAKNKVDISLNIPTQSKGIYHLRLNAIDLNTQHQVMDRLDVEL